MSAVDALTWMLAALTGVLMLTVGFYLLRQRRAFHPCTPYCNGPCSQECEGNGLL